MSRSIKGKIGVLIEEHFDATEFRRFNEQLPARGYEVDYASHLWGNTSLRFGSNPDNGEVEEHVVVTTEVSTMDLAAYKGIIAIGAYAMDRLRYDPVARKGRKCQAPAVELLRRAAATEGLKLGAICHSLWLYCADPDLLRGRRVTCAHNILWDVLNAGGEVVYEGDATADIVIDGDLVTGRHPEVVDRFMDVFLGEIEAEDARRAARAI